MARIFALTTITTNLTAAGTPQVLSATEIFTPNFEVYAPSANAGANIYITRSTAGGAQRPIPRGSAWSPPDTSLKGTSGMYDLSEIYFDGDTTNDDIVITYVTISRDTN